MSTLEIPACSLCGGNCLKCFHSDECLQWLDKAPHTVASVTVNCARLALCESRHPMPSEVDGSIFPQVINPTDLLKIRVICKRSLDTAVKANGCEYLVCYVTGLSVALVEVINWCKRNNVNLVLMHFNRDNGEYFSQVVEM